MLKKQGKPERNWVFANPRIGEPVPRHSVTCFPVRGRTGYSPVHPFCSLAAAAELTVAHGFASPPYGGFAFSGMNGVVIRAGRPGLPAESPPRLATPFAD
jgi:hypothetical protein